MLILTWTKRLDQKGIRPGKPAGMVPECNHGRFERPTSLTMLDRMWQMFWRTALDGDDQNPRPTSMILSGVGGVMRLSLG